MAIDRRTILAAIAAETAERSGPMPAWLVTIAVNAKSKADQNAVDAELVALRTAGLIDYHRDGGTGSGLELTAEGRQALKDLNQGKPGPKLPAKPKSKPKSKPPAAPSPAPTPAPAPPPLPPESPPSSPTAPEVVTHAASPELFTLLCDLAGLVSDGIAAAMAAGDLQEAQRLGGLGLRIQHHTGGPRS